MSAPPPGSVAVIGLGKIGLPLAAQFASRGLSVIGCDIVPSIVGRINEGGNPLPDEPGIDEIIARAVPDGRLRATTDVASAIGSAGVIVVIVPVKASDGGVLDTGALDAATSAIGTAIRTGTLVIYEMTLPVGMTRQLGARIAGASGLSLGSDFFVAYSPERVYSGRVLSDLGRYPKIVGGVDPPSGARAAEFYRAALAPADAGAPDRVTLLSSADAAEFTKLIETTYRDVNIALANEFALFADRWGLDIGEAVDAANRQPFSHIHRPGVGVGGHCIPVYPHFLLNDARGGADLTLARAARTRNDAMADYGVARLVEELGDLRDRRVLIFGYSYRENVREDHLSSARRLVDALRGRGARPAVHDPFYSADDLRERGYEPFAIDNPPEAEAVILQAYHRAYRAIDWGKLAGCRVLLDGRNALDGAAIEAAGIRYLGIGRRAQRDTVRYRRA